MMKFRLLAGQHVQNDPEGKERRFFTGDIIEASSDLAARFNGHGVPPKFERLQDTPAMGQTMEGPISVEEAARRGFDPAVSNLSNAGMQSHSKVNQPAIPPAAEATLESMSIKELQSMAAEEEIDLKGAKTKDDIIRIIKAAAVTV